MTPRQSQLVFAGLFAAFWFCLQPSAARAEASKPLVGSRPNIILVMTDDQGMGEISCLGNPVLRTPNLDRLHAQSLHLTDFHVSPTCSPTRAAIMSGRHEFKNGVTHTILERERLSLQTVTVAQMLKAAGYTTGIFGKWHLGDEDPYQPQQRGFDEAFIHGAGGIGQLYPGSCADAPPNREHPYFDPVVRHNGKFVQTSGFCTDVFFRQALGWIKQKAEEDRPFFAYITPNAPHGPMIAPEKYKRPFLEMGYDDTTAARWGMIVNIDDNVGLLLDKLAQWRLEENTLLIFMTDNGQSYRSGKLHGRQVNLYAGGLRAGKGSPYEGGTRVPCFWRWKGTLPAGRDVDRLAAHIDLFPTFAELVGGTLPENQVEGRSLLPLLADPGATWSDRYLFVHVGRWPKGEDPDRSKYQRCAVRSSRFRLVNNAELYDIASDPGETTNVIDQYPEVVQPMREAYDRWWSEARPLMVNEDVPLAEEHPFPAWYERQLKEEGIPNWVPPEL